MIDPTLNPDDPAWLDCSIDEFRAALLDDSFPYEHAKFLISIWLARFCYVNDRDFSFFNALYKSLITKRLDSVFAEFENLFSQFWPDLRSEVLIHPRILLWLSTYSDRSALFVQKGGFEVAIASEWGDRDEFLDTVHEVFDNTFCDFDEDGLIIPLSPEEYRERTNIVNLLREYHSQETRSQASVESAVRVVKPNETSFQEETALRNFGYRVGKSSPLTESERRDLLIDFYSSDFETRAKSDPLFQNIGEHESGERLGYMVAVIASNIRRFFHNDSEKYEYAIRHWIEDLRFLRLKFEDSTGWWPEIETTIYDFYGYR